MTEADEGARGTPVASEEFHDAAHSRTLKGSAWVQACLREGMRIFPPVPTLTREAERDMDLGGHKVPKGTMLGVAVYSMHNNPAYWQVGGTTCCMQRHPSWVGVTCDELDRYTSVPTDLISMKTSHWCRSMTDRSSSNYCMLFTCKAALPVIIGACSVLMSAFLFSK